MAGLVQAVFRDGLAFAGVFSHLSVAQVSPRTNAGDRCVDFISFARLRLMDKSFPNSLLNVTLTSNVKTTTSAHYSKLVEQQREFFLTGATRPQSWRRAQLEAVRTLFR